MPDISPLGTAPGATGSVGATTWSRMMLVPTQAEIENELRQLDNLRAELAMQHVASAARLPSPLPSPWHVGHLRAGLGRAVTWLAALVTIG